MMPSNAAIRNPIYPNIDHVILTLEDFDFEAAHREGWTICNLGTYGDGPLVWSWNDWIDPTRAPRHSRRIATFGLTSSPEPSNLLCCISRRLLSSIGENAWRCLLIADREF